MYVVQYRFKPSGSWACCTKPMESLDEALRVLKTKFPANCYRIAEAYTVTRYKPVRFAKEETLK